MSIRPIPHALAVLVALVLSAIIAAGSPLRAQAPATRQATEARFREWLAQTVWPDAQKQGVSRDTFDGALAAVTLEQLARERHLENA